jgi:hypothetical protein
VEKPKLLFAAKALQVPCLICKSWKWYVRCLCLKNLRPCHKCFKFIILGAKPLHDVHQWCLARWLWHDIRYLVGVCDDLVMRICDLAWSLWSICCMCSVWLCLGPMLMRGKFLWKMLHFHHCYVPCLYVPLYLVGDACAQIVAILLVYVSILACCNALCIFEKHMLTLVDLIHAFPTRGRKVPNSCFQGELCIKERKIWEKCICSGGACIRAFGSSFSPKF